MIKLTNNTAIGENETLTLKAVYPNKVMAAIIDADMLAQLMPNTRVEIDCFGFNIALPVECRYEDIYSEYKNWKQSKSE